MHRPSCTSYQLGLITTTRFTRTRHSDIVHPVSSSQLTEARDRVRSFGGYNNIGRRHSITSSARANNMLPGCSNLVKSFSYVPLEEASLVLS